MEMFDATSTADDVLTGADLRGRRILVTGISVGIGVETARSLSAHGAWVVGTVRETLWVGTNSHRLDRRPFVFLAVLVS